jgi:hypothetical protein
LAVSSKVSRTCRRKKVQYFALLQKCNFSGPVAASMASPMRGTWRLATLAQSVALRYQMAGMTSRRDWQLIRIGAAHIEAVCYASST